MAGDQGGFRLITMTQAEVCETLAITPRTLRRWRRDGTFEVRPIGDGRRLVFLRADIERYLRRARRA